MSFSLKDVDKEGFSAKIATISCDITGFKMMEAIIRDGNDTNNYINVKWDDNPEYTSGVCDIRGKLFFSPIETATQKTLIVSVSTEKKNNDYYHKVVVKKIK